MRRIIGIALLGILLTAGAGLAFLDHMHSTLDQPASLRATLIYTVPPHAHFARIAADLHARGAIAHPRLWSLYARWNGYATRVKAGEYAFEPGITPRRLLQQLVAGTVVLHSFTIVDGWRVRDLLAALRQNVRIHSTLPADTTAANLMQHLGFTEGSAEGQFLPETYRFPGGTTDVVLLRQAHAALQKELDSVWAGRDPGIPLRSPQQLLILASIVEKETALGSERARIAGVYVQRLLQGMRLQADPTVIYGLGEHYDGNIRLADLRADGPYNTYTRAGLPPTPIALPGAASLLATAHPDMSGDIYFVASGAGDGSHVFSRTYEQHSRAVTHYLEAIRRRATRVESP